MRFIVVGLLCSLTLFSCVDRSDNKVQKSSAKYAKGFSIEKHDGYVKLTVINPWENAANIDYDYYLFPKTTSVPEGFDDKHVIKTPVSKVVCLSTTHIGFIDKLDELDAISGVSGANYVYNSELNKAIKSAAVPDVGYDQNLNYELLLEMKPELVLVYGIGGETAAFVNKLRDLGLNVVLVAEYLESSALGKAEWISFFGNLFQKDAMADSIFKATELEYNNLKKQVATSQNTPVVMTSLPFKENWWVPGGKSYFAKLIKDAGGEYIWSENEKNESFVVSVENMLVKSAIADIWLNVGNVNSLTELLEIDERYSNFAPVKNNKVYNSNRRMSEKGGNDFWESGVVNPQVILKDLIQIIHPEIELNTKRKLYYYQYLNFEK